MNKLNRKQIPQSCGVYFFRDKSGQILYIGKAINLRNRLGSYFNSQPKDSRISKMLELASKVSWREVDSEIEALILESALVKKHQPPFNVMLRDDKQYFYVGISDDRFPKIFLTHQPYLQSIGLASKNDYIGPFTEGASIKTALRLLRRIFPYCSCKQVHNNYCLNYHIGKCPGFCCLKNRERVSTSVTEDRGLYKRNVLAIRDVLMGKRRSVIGRFEKEMMKSAHKGNLELAIELRDKITRLRRVFENAEIINKTHDIKNEALIGKVLKNLSKTLGLNRLPKRIEGYDISNIQGKFATGAMVVFTDGRPDKSQYRKFKIKRSDEPNDIAMLEELLTRRLGHPEWPYADLIVIDGGKGQLSAAKKVFQAPQLRQGFAGQASFKFQDVRIVALTKDVRHRGDHIFLDNKKTAVPLKKLPESVRNLILQVDAEAHRFAISYYRKLHRRLN